MDESERLGMQGLTRKELEAVLYELAVFGIDCSFAYFRTVIPLVVEERVAYPVEMYSDLMCASCLQTALHDCDISETLKYAVMRNGMLAMVSLGEYLEAHPVVRVSSDIACDCALVILQIAPYYSHITTLDRMYEELFRKVQLGLETEGDLMCPCRFYVPVRPSFHPERQAPEIFPDGGPGHLREFR
jgi:hypothetical protein